MLNVQDGKIRNAAQGALLELESKISDINIKAKSMAVDEMGYDLLLREGMVKMNAERNRIQKLVQEKEKRVNEIKMLNREGQLTERAMIEEQRHLNEINRLNDRINKESVKNEHLRNLNRYIRQSKF